MKKFFPDILKRSFSRELLVILAIIVIGAVLRLYNLESGMHYMGDEGRDAQIAKKIVAFEHFPLVGPPTSVGTIYLGPLYFYLMAPFLGLFAFQPLGAAVFVVLLSLATIGLIYFLAKEMFRSHLAGVLSALFYAVSPIAVEYGRWPWNPNVMPFFAALFILSLWMVLEKKKERWFLLTGVSLAFILQSHYMGLAALPVLLAALIIKRPKIKKKINYLLGLALFLFLMSPLLIFDLRHDFLNSKGLWQIIRERREGGFSLYDLLSRTRDRIRQVFGSYSGFGERAILNNLTLIFGIVVWLFLERKRQKWWLLGIWIVFGALFMGLYQGPFYLHYLEFLLPACALFLGSLLAIIIGKKGLLKILGILLAFSLTGFFLFQSKAIVMQTRIPNVETTKELVEFIFEKSANKPFNFSLLAENNYDSAYRYFFELGNMPAEYNQVTEQLFVVCEGEDVCKPEGNPKWEIAVFDAAFNGKIERSAEWQFYNYFKVIKFEPLEKM